MDNNRWLIWMALCLCVFPILAIFINSCNSSDKSISETREMKAGTPDTVTIRTVDTLWMEKIITKTIRIPEENLQQFGKDSSRFDTTITKDDSSIRVAGTTFPAIDSLRLDVASLFKYPEITRTDTILISRVDTLQITKIMETASEVPWYDRFWTGVVVSAIPVIAYIFLQK